MEHVSLETLLQGVTWTRSNYIGPHEYFTRERFPVEFQRIYKVIVQFGVNEMFMGRSYRYYKLGFHKYWRVGNCLNRVLISQNKETKWF